MLFRSLEGEEQQNAVNEANAFHKESQEEADVYYMQNQIFLAIFAGLWAASSYISYNNQPALLSSHKNVGKTGSGEKIGLKHSNKNWQMQVSPAFDRQTASHEKKLSLQLNLKLEF